MTLRRVRVHRASCVPRLLAVLVCAGALASCSHGSSRGTASPTTSVAPRTAVLVTIGSDATFGNPDFPLTDSWPQKLYHSSFPQSAVLVNAADHAAVTVNSAISVQVPLALEQRATVVGVWLGDIDLATGIPAAIFETRLDDLVKRLRDSGARVLLGNLSTAQPGAADYDNAIANVARARGATLVDIAAALSSTPDIGPSSSSMTPTISGRVADAFSAAIAGS
jgi:hypothetical protein